LTIKGEIDAIRNYLSLCEMLLASLELQSSTEDDLKMVDNETDYRLKFVVIYRLERKKIV